MLGELDGEVVLGTVESIEEDMVRMSLDCSGVPDLPADGIANTTGFCALADFDAAPEIGAPVEVLVDGADADDRSRLLVSKSRAEFIRLYTSLEESFHNKSRVTGTVVATVKGGFSVDIGLRAFLPASQTEVLSPPNTLVGVEVEAEIIKFQSNRGNVVLSRKAIVAQERQGKRAALLERLAEGDVIEGTILRFTDFGAFVDIGGVDGLLHNNDMSWGRIRHGSEVFRKRQSLRVKVLKIERGGERISLGHKQTLEDPWVSVAERYHAGKKIRGTVASLAPYGAFVTLEPGVEGLVHVSELSWNSRGGRATDVLQVGEKVDAVVLGVDSKARRLSLGMKQLQDNPWQAFAAAHPQGSRAHGPVVGLTDFGVFVRLAEGIDGLIHVSDMSWTESVTEPGNLFKEGDEVDVMILRIEAEQQRLSLGVKQLTADPWAAFVKAYPKGSKVSAKVVKTMDKAAELQLDVDIEGLPQITAVCRISEMAVERIDRVSEAMKVGDTLEVALLGVDRRRQRVDVSLKALLLGDVDYKKYMATSGFTNNPLADALKGIESKE